MCMCVTVCGGLCACACSFVCFMCVAACVLLCHHGCVVCACFHVTCLCVFVDASVAVCIHLRVGLYLCVSLVLHPCVSVLKPAIVVKFPWSTGRGAP